MKWKIMPASEFGAHRDAWLDLLGRARANQLLDHEFVTALLDHFGESGLRLAIAGDQDHPDGMTILESAGKGRWSVFQRSQSPLGIWLLDRAVNLHEALSSLMAALPVTTLQLSVTQQDPALTPRPDGGKGLRTVDYIETARITVPGSFEEYWSKRGRNLRKNLRRQRNGLERDGVEIRLETLDRPEDAERAIAEYGRLESAGWKAELGTAIHPQNPQGRFYRQLLDTYLPRGEAVVYQYRFGTELVATDLCIRRDGTLIILKTTYDEAQSSGSPAHLMRQEVFERIFSDGSCCAVEFYGKVMDWHRKWSDEIRRMYHVNAFRWSWLPAARDLANSLSKRGGHVQERD